jgi:hypothetical protein
LPRLEALYREYGSTGLEVIALTAGSPQDRAEAYFHRAGFTFNAGRIDAAFFRRHRFSVDGKPLYAMSTFLLDRSGKIVFRDYQTDYGDLRAELSKLGFTQH